MGHTCLKGDAQPVSWHAFPFKRVYWTRGHYQKKKKKGVQFNCLYSFNIVLWCPLLISCPLSREMPSSSLSLNEESAMRQIVCTCKYVPQKMTKRPISKTKWCGRLWVQGALKFFVKPQIGYQCVTAWRCWEKKLTFNGKKEWSDGRYGKDGK